MLNVFRVNLPFNGINECHFLFRPVEDILDSLSQHSFADHTLDVFRPAHGGLVIRSPLWLSPVGEAKHFRGCGQKRSAGWGNISSAGRMGAWCAFQKQEGHAHVHNLQMACCFTHWDHVLMTAQYMTGYQNSGTPLAALWAVILQHLY